MSAAAPLASIAAIGGMRNLLRLESLALLGLAAGLYRLVSGDVLLFAELFLLPDVSIAFYLFGPRIGAAAYNITHSMLGPSALAAFALVTGQHIALMVSLIWFAHIGFDRALGYGLKHATGFSDTHLGRIGWKD
jgi:hypothetical protein